MDFSPRQAGVVAHVHDALAQVRALRQLVDRQRFTGYSGPVRMATAGVALLATLVLASGRVPMTAEVHLAAWGVVFAAALLMDYSALLYWFLNDPKVGREWRRLKPALDVVPPLLVGGVLTLAVILRQEYDLLFGIWMCLFGLANFTSRHVLPRSMAYVGMFYMVAGALCLVVPGVTFTNPWPMGLVYGLGEFMGGWILHVDNTRKLLD